MCAERDRLEALAKRLHALSSGNAQELSRMKEQQQLLKQELQQRAAQHGQSHTLSPTALVPKPVGWGGGTRWCSQ